MEKILREKDLGPEAKMVAKYWDGKIVLGVDYVGADGGASLSASIEIMKILEELAKKTDNTLDDAAVSMIRGALGL